MYASGIRNSLGFTWHPETGEMWFTDNGRDNMEMMCRPASSIMRPWQVCILDFPTSRNGHSGSRVWRGGGRRVSLPLPAQPLGAHVSPLGLEFVSGAGFPASFQNKILIAEPWVLESEQKGWLPDLYGLF